MANTSRRSTATSSGGAPQALRRWTSARRRRPRSLVRSRARSSSSDPPSAVLTAAPASCSLALAVRSKSGDEVGDFDFGDEGGGMHQGFLSLCLPDISSLAGVGGDVKPEIRDVRHCEAEYRRLGPDSGVGVPARGPAFAGTPACQDADCYGDGRPEAPHQAHPPTSSRTRSSASRSSRSRWPSSRERTPGVILTSPSSGASTMKRRPSTRLT